MSAPRNGPRRSLSTSLRVRARLSHTKSLIWRRNELAREGKVVAHEVAYLAQKRHRVLKERVCDQRVYGGRYLLRQVVHRLAHQLVHAVEVRVERAAVEVRAARDVRHGDLVVRLLGDEQGQGLLQKADGPLRVAVPAGFHVSSPAWAPAGAAVLLAHLRGNLFGFKHDSKCCAKSSLAAHIPYAWVFFNMCMFYHM